MGQTLRSKSDHSTNLKDSIANFPSSKDRIKNKLNFKYQNYCLPKELAFKYYLK